jgi:hypothetical protein
MREEKRNRSMHTQNFQRSREKGANQPERQTPHLMIYDKDTSTLAYSCPALIAE